MNQSFKNEFKFWFPLFLAVTITITALTFININANKNKEKSVKSFIELTPTNDFYAIYTFKLTEKNKEARWSDELSKKLNGQREIAIQSGRIDILTDSLVIEVERIDKWHEGIGQALHYGLFSNKSPTLAIITRPPQSKCEKIRMETIQLVCFNNSINLILLMPK